MKASEFRNLLSAPFIYSMFIPVGFFHIFLEIYHQIAFRLYGIPTVNPREYFYIRRDLLPLLNWFEKFNCIYCSYVNNFLQYAVEIGARTERYWCPLKYEHKIPHAHSQYSHFIDASNSQNFRSEWKRLRNFKDVN